MALQHQPFGPGPPPFGGVTMERLRTLRPEILEIAARHHVVNVRVVGSVARLESDPGDVDLMVDIDPSSRLDGVHYFSELERFREDVAALLSCDVDVLDAKVVERQQQQSNFRKSLYERVTRDAVLL